MLVTIANTSLTGLKNLVAPDASMEDGLLDISVYSGFSKAEVLGYFAKTANERTIPDGAVQRCRLGGRSGYCFADLNNVDRIILSTS